jgi:hypothetical protein
MRTVPCLLTVIGGILFAVAFLTSQLKIKRLGSEQKKEQSAIALVV